MHNLLMVGNMLRAISRCFCRVDRTPCPCSSAASSRPFSSCVSCCTISPCRSCATSPTGRCCSCGAAEQRSSGAAEQRSTEWRSSGAAEQQAASSTTSVVNICGATGASTTHTTPSRRLAPPGASRLSPPGASRLPYPNHGASRPHQRTLDQRRLRPCPRQRGRAVHTRACMHLRRRMHS